MAYDGQTHEYTIHRNQIIDGKYLIKKIVVVCESYQWGGRPPNKEPTACELEVGSFYPVGPAALTRDEGPAVVTELNARLTIIEKWGTKEEVFQSFKVVSNEVLPDNGCR
jgi:hypothetical protein